MTNIDQTSVAVKSVTKKDMQDIAKQWIAGGFEEALIPLVSGKKNPSISDWVNARLAGDDILKAVGRGQNVGILTADYPAFDIEDTEYADDILALLQKRFPTAPVRYRPGSKSRAMLVRFIDPCGTNVEWTSGGLTEVTGRKVCELLGVGRQLMVEGRHPSGTMVEWTARPKLEDLPEAGFFDLSEAFDDVRAMLVDKGLDIRVSTGRRNNTPDNMLNVTNRPTIVPDSFLDTCADEKLEKLVSLIPNGSEFIDRDKWVELGHAIYGASGGSQKGKEIWSDWSNQVPQYPVDAPEQFWETIKAENVRAGASLVESWAQKFNPVEVARLELGPLPFEDKADHLSKEWKQAIKRLRASRDEAGQDAFYGDSGDEGFVEIDFSSKRPLPYIRPDITDWHARGEVSVLAAAPGTGKSTLSCLYATALILEKPDLIGIDKLDWTGDVVIISNEDRLASIQRKLDAYAQLLNVQDDEIINKAWVWNERLAVVSKTGQLGIAPTRDAVRFVDRLSDLRRNRSVCMVIVDTLASAVDGGDENSVGDMQALMNACGDIAQAGFCSVVLIHHVRKSTNETDDTLSLNDVRGSGAIGGAVRAGAGIVKCGEKRRDEVGWTEDERRRTIRFDGIKANDRALAKERFYRFENITLPARDPRDLSKTATQDAGALRLIPTPKPVKTDWKTRTKDCLEVALRSGEQLTVDNSLTGPFARSSAVAHVIDMESADRRKDRRDVRDAVAGLIEERSLVVDVRSDKNGNEKRFLKLP